MKEISGFIYLRNFRDSKSLNIEDAGVGERGVNKKNT